MGVQESEQLWGGETTKAVANFPVSGERVPVPVIRWLGRIKGAAARVNAELGLLDAELAERDRRRRRPRRRRRARRPVPDRRLPDRLGHLDEHERQRGDRQPRRRDGAHPNDHVNMGQSSNDVFPSAVHLAALDAGDQRAAARAARARGRASRQGRRVPRHRQVRAHAPDGRRPGHARPGVLRLRRAGAPRRPARSQRAAAGRADPARRHRHRHRPEHAQGVRRPRSGRG